MREKACGCLLWEMGYIKHSKPHPEVFQKAAKYLKLPVESCCVVEDADAGIMVAKKAGMKAIGIGDAARLEQADIRLQCFVELMDHLK